MTRGAWSLREVPPERVAQEAVFGRCVALGWPVQWIPLPADVGLLRFRQVGEHGEVTSLVPTASWAEQHWPSLPGLAWDALDPVSAQTLFGTVEAGPVEAPWLHGATEWQGLVTSADQVSTPRPCVRTAAGPVWIEELQVDTGWMPGLILPHQVALQVQYRLARLTLTLAQLRRLRVGDTVIVPQTEPMALVSGHPLFSFGFHEGHMIITELDHPLALGDLALSSGDDSTLAPDAPSLKLAVVPVTVDVVLCRMTLTVGELAQLRPGSTLKLAEDAHRQIELRVNGQLLARGELVQVGERLGVQIEAHVSTT